MLILTAAVDVILVIAAFSLMNYVRFLLDQDVRINLTEIVTQNKDVITSKLAMELNNLDLDAQHLSERFLQLQEFNQDTMGETFREYIKEKGNEALILADKNGDAIGLNGEEFNIYGRNYFQIGMQGKANISDRLISRINGDDIFVVCVPLKFNGEIIGTLQRQYTPQEMYELCSVSLFSEQGSTYIINSQGYIMVCSQTSQYSRESDNYYRIIYLTDSQASKRLEKDILSEKSGFMDAMIDGEEVFFAYTPIEEVHDWFLISSIAKSAVSPNSNVVVNLFYCVLAVVTLTFTVAMLYYWWIKRKQQARLEKIAFVDEVTGGNSYTRFTVDIQSALKKQGTSPFHICIFDIDNFKYINSFYGYETGDRILKSIHDQYKEKLNENEMIARITGDQFVMLLEDVSQKRLEELIKMEFSFDNIKVYLSAGMYAITDQGESIQLMVDKASTAAKRSKGRHFKQVETYSEAYGQETAHNEQMKRAVEQALDHDEIIPFFQPKVDIRTRELVGAEALARWRTVEGKIVPPGDFIPICEKTGLVTLLDMTVFRKTLEFISRNLKEGIKCVPVSVNFSRLHLLDKDFIQNILNLLSHYEVPPQYIELELTESVLYDNYDTISSFINELHHHGLKISMDDFGSGYSSLHMLKDIDIDVMKIDRFFLMDTANNDRQRTIFGSIVQMAKRLDIEVIVEGVETQENVNLMDEFGCAFAQGFYYSRPLDMEAFEQIYRKGAM